MVTWSTLSQLESSQGLWPLERASRVKQSNVHSFILCQYHKESTYKVLFSKTTQIVPVLFVSNSGSHSQLLLVLTHVAHFGVLGLPILQSRLWVQYLSLLSSQENKVQS